MVWLKRLAEIRATRGITQQELSEKSGVAQDRISLYETGKAKPFPDNLKKLACALNCTTDELLGVG